jgi:hypothetical protein
LSIALEHLFLLLFFLIITIDKHSIIFHEPICNSLSLFSLSLFIDYQKREDVIVIELP